MRLGAYEDRDLSGWEPMRIGVRLLAGESTQARVGGADEPARESQDQNGEAPTFAVFWNDTANAPKRKRRIEET